MSIENFFSKLLPLKPSKKTFESIKTLSTCLNPQSDSVVFVKDNKFFKQLKTSLIAKAPNDLWVIAEEKLFNNLVEQEKSFLAEKSSALYLIDKAMLGLCELSKYFFDKKLKLQNDFVDGRQMGTATVHHDALIAQNVFIGANVKIAAGVRIYSGCIVMSDSEIGEDTILYPNVVLYPETKLGKNCILHAGCLLGADGFGFYFDSGKHHKIYHLGSVVIGNEVELGAGSTIDRGTIDSTVIGNGVKIDNLVHVAHNCQLGDGVLLCGQAGLAGSVKVGQFSVLGGKAAVGPDLVIGEQSQIGGMAGVIGNLEKASKVAGHPARPVNEWLRGVAQMRKLSEKKVSKDE